MRSFGPFMQAAVSFRACAIGFRMIALFSEFPAGSPGANPRYVIDWPANTLTPPYSSLLRPTCRRGKDQLVLGASNEAAEQALGQGSRVATG